MRLWTVHPAYLDPTGLVALWREALLAQKVLRGETRGYRNHPQLIRFRAQPDHLSLIASYLEAVLEESIRRGYSFDGSKIASGRFHGSIAETEGQLLYEWEHLKGKLLKRSPALYVNYEQIERPVSHPLFHIVPGDMRDWERGAG